MKKQIIIIRTCKEQGTTEEVSLRYAIDKLEGYWTNIETLLIKGEVLWTPYATYQIKK